MTGKIMLPDAQVLTLTEVASLLRVPKSTVYKLAQNAKLPGFKVGKHWRFLLRDIEEWLKNHGAAEPGSDRQSSGRVCLISGGER
jgi:excisionase family DNA binding protein